MKNLMIVFAALAASNAFATITSNDCGANQTPKSNVKKVCLAQAKEGVDQSVIILTLDSGKKEYLLQDGKATYTGGGEQAGGDQTGIFRVIETDGNLNKIGSTLRTVQIEKSWDYSEGFVKVTGKSSEGDAFYAIVETPDERKQDGEFSSNVSDSEIGYTRNWLCTSKSGALQVTVNQIEFNGYVATVYGRPDGVTLYKKDVTLEPTPSMRMGAPNIYKGPGFELEIKVDTLKQVAILNIPSLKIVDEEMTCKLAE